MSNLRNYFEDGNLEACDEVCGKKREGEIKEIHGAGMKR